MYQIIEFHFIVLSFNHLRLVVKRGKQFVVYAFKSKYEPNARSYSFYLTRCTRVISAEGFMGFLLGYLGRTTKKYHTK